MSFADSLARSRQGDSGAQDALFDRWRPLLRLQARRLLGPELSARVDPSDVVQESLLQAAQDLAKFRGTSQGEWVAWLRCIVAGQTAKVRRHHHAERRNPDREAAAPEFEAVDAQAGVVDRLIDVEEAAQLAAAIEGLPADLHQVVVRRVFHGQPFDAVAAALDCSPGTARGLWTQALRRLRELLAADA